MSDPNPTPKWILVASWPARLIAGAVFIYAAVLKLIDPVAFAQDIANYQAFPYWSWNLAAAVVPVAELLGGVALITGFKRRAGSLVLGALTVAFIGLILSVIVRGIDLDCGCFGEAAQASAVGWPLLLRDLGLLVAIVAAYLPPERSANSSTTRLQRIDTVAKNF
jgi:uncharacterized membrane protein YphA (DoxX/SURF4 family)